MVVDEKVAVGRLGVVACPCRVDLLFSDVWERSGDAVCKSAQDSQSEGEVEED